MTGELEQPTLCPEPDWTNPAWILAVMHFPREPTLLAELGEPSFRLVAPRHFMKQEKMKRFARRGIVAGDVLMVIYAMQAIAHPGTELWQGNLHHAQFRH